MYVYDVAHAGPFARRLSMKNPRDWVRVRGRDRLQGVDMTQDTQTEMRPQVTTEQINRAHVFLVGELGHGVDPAIVRRTMEAAGFEWFHPIDEPRELLAVVQDRQGRRYFRWAYNSHTFSPWRDIGAVHCDTDDNFRWEDLTGDRTPVTLVREGIEESL